MNSLKNRVQLIGNLGGSPEVKTLESGRKVARVSLATSESYKNADGKKITDTQWHNLVIWGNQAAVAEKYLQKGSEIAVEGRLMYRQWEDKEGNKRFFTEINVNDFVMLRGKSTVADN